MIPAFICKRLCAWFPNEELTDLLETLVYDGNYESEVGLGLTEDGSSIVFTENFTGDRVILHDWLGFQWVTLQRFTPHLPLHYKEASVPFYYQRYFVKACNRILGARHSQAGAV